MRKPSDIEIEEGFEEFWPIFEPGFKDACFKIWLIRAAKRVGQWSRIEFFFMRAFMLENFFRGDEAYDVEGVWFSYGEEPAEKLRTLELETKIGSYRADFLLADLSGPRPIRCVIECDGHDYHERTKEQAARDRRRDRIMQRMGYSVLRFTGSELFTDPSACVTEVFDHVERLGQLNG